jgi:hypothetical protein
MPDESSDLFSSWNMCNMDIRLNFLWDSCRREAIQASLARFTYWPDSTYFCASTEEVLGGRITSQCLWWACCSDLTLCDFCFVGWFEKQRAHTPLYPGVTFWEQMNWNFTTKNRMYITKTCSEDLKNSFGQKNVIFRISFSKGKFINVTTFVFHFICGLFNDAIWSSHYIVPVMASSSICCHLTV